MVKLPLLRKMVAASWEIVSRIAVRLIHIQINQNGYSACLGCSDLTVKRALPSMVEKGVMKRIGSNS